QAARTITDTAPSAAASVGVHQPTSMISTENTMIATIGITSTKISRIFSRRDTFGAVSAGAALGSITVQAQISTPYIVARMNPGITPAISSAPTSVVPSVASSTVSAEGGMITASPPTPMIGPIDRYLLYPRRIMSGTISVPSSAQAPI